MKRNIFFSSLFLLALGLGYSACSENDLEDSVIETQSKARVISLRADINSAYTRCAIEKTSDGEDTFKITGWNDGDKVYGIYANGYRWGTVEFIYSSETQEFSAETEVGLSEIQYVFCGGELEISFDFVSSPGRAVQIYPKFDLGIDLANNLMDNIFLFGAASVENEKLIASLSPKMAIACVHNDTDEAINITGYITSEENGVKYLERMYYNTGFGSLGDNLSYWGGGSDTPTGEYVTVVTIPAHSKKYVSIPCMLKASSSIYSYGLVKVDGSAATIIAPARNDLEIGKIYKVNYDAAPVPPTTGVATRTGDIDVNWVQLWADGPKFAEYNVGAENNKPEDYGGYYCWGKTIDKDETGNYKDGSSDLTGTDDTATNLWGDNWRMPTSDELQGLLDYCDVEWTTVNGTNGLKLTGRGIYASNSLFLPAADAFGYHGSSWGVDSAGSIGSYWSSTPYGSFDAYYLDFTENRHNVITCVRGVGYSARAVFIGE